MSASTPETLGAGQQNPEDQARMIMTMQALFGERGGLSSEITKLKDPSKLEYAIDVIAGVAVGLPVPRRETTVAVGGIDENGDFKMEEISHKIISDEELMQVFMSPDWLADRGGSGYYARMALDQAMDGSGRMDVLTGELGPGKFDEKSARALVDELVRRGRLPPNQAESTAGRLVGRLRYEAMEVANLLRDRAPRYEAQKVMWKAFMDHQQVAGDEKSGSGIFVTAGHSEPQGPDWKAFFSDQVERSDGSGEKIYPRDRALRVIVAAGMSGEELRRQGKDYLLMPEIHQHVNQRGVTEHYNPYSHGWTTETFNAWMDKLMEATDGDLLAAYDAWYVAIMTGLVAKVAVSDDGEKVGDPPIVSALDAWLMHFKEKQLAEAGLDGRGGRTKYQIYKSKTGPIAGIGKYPASWTGCFFENTTIGEDGSSVYEEWWTKGRSMAEIEWLKTDVEGATEEEVRMTSFNGYLYKKFQLYKMFDAVQGTAKLKDLAEYTYFDGMARSLDKAFGVVYSKPGTISDAKWMAAVAEAQAEGKVVGPRKTVTRDGVQFIQVVPDSMNPRLSLLETLLVRYYPSGSLKPGMIADSSWTLGERFSSYSEINALSDPMEKLRRLQSPGGVFIESFVATYLNSGMATLEEIVATMGKVYSEKAIKEIFSFGALKVVAQARGLKF